MSDGPYKSLPQRPHWKAVMRRASNLSTPISEVCEASEIAIKRDLFNLPISRMREIIESSLFPDDSTRQLEALSLAHAGDVAVQQALDHAIDALQQGIRGDAAIQASVEGAVNEALRSHCRGMEEHHERSGAAKAGQLRGRLRELRETFDLKRVAKEITNPLTRVRRSKLRLTQRSGLDDGVPKL